MFAKFFQLFSEDTSFCMLKINALKSISPKMFCFSIFNLFAFHFVFVCFFFFQAEDGIRDIGVTGVQTCALPISVERVCLLVPRSRLGDRPDGAGLGAATLLYRCNGWSKGARHAQIGRASGRERV